MRWLVPSLLGLVVVAAIAFAWRTGVFLPVTVEEKNWPPVQAVWKTHIGPYHLVLADLQEVEKWLKESAQTGCQDSFGRYLDDPDSVEHERLRAQVGCLVNRMPDAALPAGYEFGQLEPKHVVVAEYKGSPALGPYKVYGKARKYIVEKGLKPAGAPIEIYRQLSPTEMTTLYLFPVE